MPGMSTSHSESEAVGERLAQAAARLRAQPAQPPASDVPAAGSLTAPQALVLLREACDGLAATELEVRRARAEIARIAARAAARRTPPDAA
jgi:hypothetical protein